ncbi:hypothetical protein [Nitrincola sp. MINF-07-Sa-05]|uniref:hypothetical protein n=1 Tax=Nitrincola salilacus TaxID=3400273 RepID=UPI003917C613
MQDNGSKLVSDALEIAYFLRVGEVNYAYGLCPDFIDCLEMDLAEKQKLKIENVLQAMLMAQKNNNTVWFADLIEYMLVPNLVADGEVK